ncbi:MAG TPA: hypothetical protein VGM88_26645 [Kofleriaceae bacterium]|jgi:hypothetical protein
MKLATTVLLLGSTRLAFAQPADEPAPPAPPPPAPMLAPPPPTPAPIPPTALPVAHGRRENSLAGDRSRWEDERPTPREFSIGIGVGYSLPTSLEVPNLTSVRFRWANGITLEPFLALANTGDKVDTGMPETTNTSEFGVGATVRVAVAWHRGAQLEVLGRLSVDQTTQDPPGDENSTTLTNVQLGYGVAVEYWLSHHWNLSVTAANPILSIAKTHQDEGPAVTVDTTTTIGLIWNPTVDVMVHLYF